MTENLVHKAKNIISKILYITIATSDKNNQPWNSPVYSAFDQDFNFYWASWKENQHSRNIAENENVFIVIYDSTAPEGTGEGVYIKAKAYELSDASQIEKALACLYLRKGQPADKRKPSEFLGDFPRRIYKAIPEQTWINDTGSINGNFVDKRVEFKLI